ncbi:MAG TPA: lamin tail domain-containing protein [Micromonosporaceae bacterium]|nr:lamin tail domain-containing protein [Micromonosporaceae bacterium]
MTIRSRKALVAAATVLATATAGALAAAEPAYAISGDVVIAQVYGGGGNAGATLTNDYIELFNRGGAAVDLTGWSVQYASAAGTTWQVTALSGTIAPGGDYLVAESAGAGGTTPLPTPDASGSIAMSATAGKVALVTAATALGCGATCSSASGVHDFIGYGTANDFEGAAAPGLSNTTADLRAGGGTVDTDNNAADFTAGAPDPHNSAGEGPGGGNPPPTNARIHDIQGASHRSPLVGQRVTSVPGVVTAISSNGFWFQDPQPDDNIATSEGLFVFTSSRPTVAIADSVLVSGTVAEFREGGAATNLSNTEIDGPQITVVASGAALPVPVVIGPGGRVAPDLPRGDSPGDVEKGPFDPTTNALDFYESMEGMLVQVNDAQAVGPTNQFGEIPIVPAGSDAIRTPRGGVLLTQTDPNTERLIMDSTLAPVPDANVGAVFPGASVGVLDYDFGNYYFHPLAAPTVTPSPIQPEVTAKQGPLDLAIATYNVENLAPTDPQDKFDRLAVGLVHNLQSPDIVSLEEIQDNDGATDDGVVAANVTLDKLVAAIRAAGGPTYAYREIDPVNDTNGGEPGGNIRVAFLFRTDRGMQFIDRPGGSATSSVGVTRVLGTAQLTQSPGLIDPTNAAWDDSRKPLVGEFRFKGRQVIVIGNHFDSKGGDDPLMGRFQPPSTPSEVQRLQQATVERGFVDQIRAADPDAAVVVLGDLNDFQFSNTADILVGDGYLTDLPRTLPQPEQYSYDFEGNSEVLDHILISSALDGEPHQYDIVHINAEFANQTSDHDPQVVRFPLFPIAGLLG